MKNLEERKTFGNVRPVHKARLAAEKLQADKDQRHPEPMSIMRKRERELPNGEYRKPEVTLGMKERVALAVAAWNNADPFAYGRAYLHVSQGYIDPEDTIKEMSQRTLARQAAKIAEVDNAKAQ